MFGRKGMTGRKPENHEKEKLRLSLLQKILLLTVVTLAVPAVWFEVYSTRLVRNMMEKQAVIEVENSVALAADSIDNTARNLVLYILGMYQDPDIRRISARISEMGISEQELQQMNLEFIERADNVMRVDRVYKMDMKIYAMLTYGSQGLFNFNSYDQDRGECLQYLAENEPQNPYMISWSGLMKNYDMYRFRNEDNLILLGKKMEENKEESSVLWIGVMENSVRKQLFPSNLSGGEKRFLVDGNGRILSSGETEYIGMDIRDLVEMDLPEEEMQQTGVDSEFGEAVVACKKLGNCPWTLVGIRPYTEILDAVTEVNRSRMTVTLCYIAVFSVVAVFVIRRMTEPLRKLSVLMMEFQPGNKTDEKYMPSTGGKEVHQIYACYDKMTKNIYELMKENEEVQKEKRKTEMQLLQAQIKPHFLFNTLMSIRCAIGNGNTKKASDMTLALSMFLRNTIAKGSEIITLEEELEIITTYIRIQNDRSYQRVYFTAEIEDGLEKLRIPKLLLQPLIENSISHGFCQQEEGEIRLLARREGNMAVIIVKDNGKGFDVNPLEYCEKDQHFGVYSVQHRLKMYYGEQGYIRYESCQGTTVRIIIPILEERGDENVEDTDRG